MGTDRVLIREIAKSWEPSNNHEIIPVGKWGIIRVTIFSIIGSLLLFIWLKISADSIGALSKNGLFAILLLVPASASIIIISSFLTGMGNVKISQAITNPIRNALLLIGITFCFFLNKTNQADKILIIQVVSFILSSMIGWYWIRHKNNGPKLIEYWGKNHLKGNPSEWNLSSWHFFVGTAGILILTRIDIILVNVLSDSVTAGLYGAAVRVGQIGSIVGLSGSIWLQPRIVQYLHQNQKKALLKFLKQGICLIGSATLFLAIGIYLFADYIVLLLGPEFIFVAGPLRLIGLGYTFWAISVPFYTFLLMSGSEVKAAKILWTQVFINLGLLILLVPRFGVYGAVWSWVGGVAFNSVLSLYFGLKQLNNLTKNKTQNA